MNFVQFDMPNVALLIGESEREAIEGAVEVEKSYLRNIKLLEVQHRVESQLEINFIKRVKFLE